MFHRITCPSCQHKFTVPESAMGKLVHCPNCQSPFLAGKSVVSEEAEVAMKQQPAAASFNKTMLGETEPPIKYNCPRCKKPLESPAGEAGTKKPCPACGQRLQVPAVPKATAPQPSLNKTVLAMDESAAQPAHFPSGGPTPTMPSQTAPVPQSDAAAASKRTYTLVTAAGAGIFALALLVCVVSMAFSGGDREKILKAQADYDKAKKELDELKKSIAEKEAALAHQMKLDLEYQNQRQKLVEEQQARQRELNLRAELDAKNEEYRNNQKLAESARLKREEDQRRLDREKQEADAKYEALRLQIKTQADENRRAIELANQKAAQATIVVSQPPPVYYPPYSPYRYWGW